MWKTGDRRKWTAGRRTAVALLAVGVFMGVALTPTPGHGQSACEAMRQLANQSLQDYRQSNDRFHYDAYENYRSGYNSCIARSRSSYSAPSYSAPSHSSGSKIGAVFGIAAGILGIMSTLSSMGADQDTLDDATESYEDSWRREEQLRQEQEQRRRWEEEKRRIAEQARAAEERRRAQERLRAEQERRIAKKLQQEKDEWRRQERIKVEQKRRAAEARRLEAERQRQLEAARLRKAQIAQLNARIDASIERERAQMKELNHLYNRTRKKLLTQLASLQAGSQAGAKPGTTVLDDVFKGPGDNVFQKKKDDVFKKKNPIDKRGAARANERQRWLKAYCGSNTKGPHYATCASCVAQGLEPNSTVGSEAQCGGRIPETIQVVSKGSVLEASKAETPYAEHKPHWEDFTELAPEFVEEYAAFRRPRRDRPRDASLKSPTTSPTVDDPVDAVVSDDDASNSADIKDRIMDYLAGHSENLKSESSTAKTNTVNDHDVSRIIQKSLNFEGKNEDFYEISEIKNAWEGLKSRRRNEDPLSFDLAAAEHYMYARFLAARSGDPTVYFSPSAYAAKKKLYSYFGIRDKMRADPNNPVLPPNIDVEDWGKKGAVDGIRDFLRNNPGKSLQPFTALPSLLRDASKDYR